MFCCELIFFVIWITSAIVDRLWNRFKITSLVFSVLRIVFCSLKHGSAVIQKINTICVETTMEGANQHAKTGPGECPLPGYSSVRMLKMLNAEKALLFWCDRYLFFCYLFSLLINYDISIRSGYISYNLDSYTVCVKHCRPLLKALE